MQLDFQQFLMKLEKLTDLRPVPDKEFVETYIKAYYLTENDMEQFIKNHRVSWAVAAAVEPVLKALQDPSRIYHIPCRSLQNPSRTLQILSEPIHNYVNG